MRNFKLTIDLSNFHAELKRFTLKEYSIPFALVFIEADDPDEACNTILNRLMKLLLDQDPSIDTRILCKRIKREIRIDKIQSL